MKRHLVWGNKPSLCNWYRTSIMPDFGQLGLYCNYCNYCDYYHIRNCNFLHNHNWIPQWFWFQVLRPLVVLEIGELTDDFETALISLKRKIKKGILNSEVFLFLEMMSFQCPKVVGFQTSLLQNCYWIAIAFPNEIEFKSPLCVLSMLNNLVIIENHDNTFMHVMSSRFKTHLLLKLSDQFCIFKS